MTTYFIAIGNSDDALSQAEWALYWTSVKEVIDRHAAEIHFEGMSAATSLWQNAMWCIVLDEAVPGMSSSTEYDVQVFQDELATVALQYRQDSIAWIEAKQTVFLRLA
jgi:hypothetical protein